MEKPWPADPHQRSISPLTTGFGKPATPKPGPDVATTETSGSTLNARNEAEAGATQTPSVPEATSARTHSGSERTSSPLNTTRIVRGTPLGPTIRTTPTDFPAPPFPFVA